MELAGAFRGLVGAARLCSAALSEVEKTGEELVHIPGDSLVACSFASYLGVPPSGCVKEQLPHLHEVCL
jgi:hypothetical protein